MMTGFEAVLKRPGKVRNVKGKNDDLVEAALEVQEDIRGLSPVFSGGLICTPKSSCPRHSRLAIASQLLVQIAIG